MTPWQIIAVTAAVSLAVDTGCTLYGFGHNNDLSSMDGYWGLASLVHGLLTVLLWHPLTARGALLATIVGLWSLYLGTHLGMRWFREYRHTGGDERFRSTAETFGLGNPPLGSTTLHRIGLWLVIAVNNVMMIVVVNLPLQFAIMSTTPGLSILDCVGLAVAALGGFMEITSNRQLERFRAHSKSGQTLMSGWWYWSRHPNYFGNTLVYVGCFLVALSDPTRWWTIVSPIAMMFVLRFVLGVRMTDNAMLEKRRNNPTYLRYVHDTPAYVPLPPPLRQIRQRITPPVSVAVAEK